MVLSTDTSRLAAVLRAIATASRSLRLYPPSSPLPRQSVEATVAALEEFFFEGETMLSLAIVRDGFEWHGTTVPAVAGAAEFAGELREHGVAELDVLPGTSADELYAFLYTLSRDPESVRAEGGISAAIVVAGVDSIRVTDVRLTVVEQVVPDADEDIDDFLRRLVADPEKFAAWFAAVAQGDPATFQESLMELVRVSGPSGFEGLLKALADAFLVQESDAKDALLGLAIDRGPVHDLAGGMFAFLDSGQLAGSILGGTFGRNMLSLSTALTRLPLEQVTAQVRAEVQAMLPGSGHTDKEAEFLGHMLDVRSRNEVEPSLVDLDTTYQRVLEATTIPDDILVRARGVVAGSGELLTASSVRTMLALLKQQKNLELYCSGAESLAGMVPRLIEQRDLELALRALSEISTRESTLPAPWPEVSARLRAAVASSCGPRSMGALIDAVAEDPDQLVAAREIVRLGGETAGPALVEQAIIRKTPGLRIAGDILGRRTIDLLNQAAPTAQWFQLAPVAEALAKDGTSRSADTLDLLMSRGDEQSRREVAAGVAAAGGQLAGRVLSAALRDPSPEVAIVAARAMGRSKQQGAAAVLAARLRDLDVDGADFMLAREIIAALALTPEPAADDVLARLAARRALIKRGHFAEVQELVRQAQLVRSRSVVR